jgi:hypothetical protein
MRNSKNDPEVGNAQDSSVLIFKEKKALDDVERMCT